MRAIGFAIRRCSIEFCRELRFKATARVFELSFSPRNVGQHCVQPLWTQYQETEPKHEQDFCAKTHDSLFGYASVVGNHDCCADGLLFLSFHS